MEIIKDPACFPTRCRNGLLSIGKFDGLHSGHIAILSALVRKARQYHLSSVVFTFDPSPAEVLRPDSAPALLCDTRQKIDLISGFDPDILFLFPTTRPFLELTASEFFHRVVIDQLGAKGMVEGPTFNFGRNREGDIGVLASLCSENGVELEVVPAVTIHDRNVSSSQIRSLLSDGQVEIVRKMLRRPYRVSGLVTTGDHRGGTLGYPTANLTAIKTLLPKSGVYAARVLFGGVYYPAAVNLGGNPTFGIEETKVEVHLLDFHGDLYGESIQVDFLTRLRDVVPFSSREALLTQMSKDIASVRSEVSKLPSYPPIK